MRLIKIGAVVIAALLLAWLIYAGIEWWQRSKYEKAVKAMDLEIKAADQKAKDAQARAEVLQHALEIRYAKQHELELRAETAEANLRTARGKVVTLKETYETIKYLPLPSTPVSVASACENLAAVGYKCQ